MPVSLEALRSVRSWAKDHEANAPKVGDMAPDFELLDLEGRNAVRLSDFRGKKPDALIIGSYTRPPIVKGSVSLRDLYENDCDQVQFLLKFAIDRMIETNNARTCSS